MLYRQNNARGMLGEYEKRPQKINSLVNAYQLFKSFFFQPEQKST